MFEIEIAVLSCFAAWWDEFYSVFSAVCEDDFISAECREIYFRLRKMDKTADSTIIISGLSADARAALVNGMDMYVTNKRNFNSYLIRLKELSRSRRIKDRLYRPVNDIAYELTAAELQEIIDEEKNEFLLSYAQEAKEAVSGFAERQLHPAPKLKTGWSTLDKITGGLRIPAVSIVGALPSTGKTSFALNIVGELMKENVPIVIFSLEMNRDMIYERLTSIFNNFDYGKFTSQNFSDKDIHTLRSFETVLKSLSLYVYDEVYDVETQAIIISQLKPKFVIVDYIQKVSSKHKNESRRIEIEYVSSRYKQMAKANSCHIMVLSQLTRNSDKVQTMRSLKESGALEADGDYIMILNRPYVQDKEKGRPEEASVLVDKNKFGATGILDMNFVGQFQRFYEVVHHNEDYYVRTY